MRFNYLITLLIFFSKSISADCIVQSLEENSAKLFCVNTTETSFLINSTGQKFKVKNYNNLPSVEIHTHGESLAIGETLKPTEEFSSEKLTTSQNHFSPIEIPIDLNQSSTTTILEKFNPFKSESLRVYATALQLSGFAMDAEFDEDVAKIEQKQGEFNSLPLDLIIDLDFGTSGLILRPDFQDKTGSVAIYAKIDTLDIGGYFNVNNVNEDLKVYDSLTTYYDSENDDKSYGLGLMLRKRSIFDSGEFQFTLSLGYQYSSKESYNRISGATSDFYFNAAALDTEVAYYKMISKEFFVGAGFSLGVGVGHIEYNVGNNVLADRVTFANIEVNFLKVMMVF
ncbi:hypothetical protein [Halobacteriovorax sp.]|uniref:hypothetical protein n=1 Tax=Halobacteriovorax sp. TaxID=2020862 RepID=UPI003562F846